MSALPLDFKISLIESEDEFLAASAVELAAFAGPGVAILYGTEATPADLAVRHVRKWKNDPSARYVKAYLPSGRIIGFAKWNFFSDTGPQYPWPKECTPSANI